MELGLQKISHRGRLRKMEGSSYIGNEVVDSKEGCESHARKVLGLDYGLSPPQLTLGWNSHYEIIRRWKFHSIVTYRSRDLGGIINIKVIKIESSSLNIGGFMRGEYSPNPDYVTLCHLETLSVKRKDIV